MKVVDLYARVRRACHVDGMSQRQAARVFGIDAKTVAKMLRFAVPPGYRRSKPPVRPKLDPLLPVIDRILEEDQGRPGKQRHTARRIFERLKAEHGFAGGETIVKDYVRERRPRGQEMFVPLVHPPGHGQADFGEAIAVIGGVERQIHFLAVDLPHSDACFVRAYPAETTEAFCDGHNAAFAFFGGVPQSMLYDNTRLAVARILGDGKRQRTRAFAELQSHYLFADRFGRPGKGNDKGKVEGLVGYARRNFLVPMPRVRELRRPECPSRRTLPGAAGSPPAGPCRQHRRAAGARSRGDAAVAARTLRGLRRRSARVSSLSLVRYQGNDYSVPVAYGHREVLVRGYVETVVIGCGAAVIARHTRSYEREDLLLDPLHYLPLLEHKIGALDQAAPLAGWDLPEAFACSAGCWRRAWARQGGGSGSRFSGCWRSSGSRTCRPEWARRCGWVRSALMPSSIWSYAGSSVDRRGWT